MNNKKKIKGEIVNISVPLSLKEKIASHAKQKGYTMAGLIKELIITYVNEHESKEDDTNIQNLIIKNNELINKLIRQNEEFADLLQKMYSMVCLLYVNEKKNRLYHQNIGEEREQDQDLS